MKQISKLMMNALRHLNKEGITVSEITLWRSKPNGDVTYKFNHVNPSSEVLRFITVNSEGELLTISKAEEQKK